MSCALKQQKLLYVVYQVIKFHMIHKALGESNQYQIKVINKGK